MFCSAPLSQLNPFERRFLDVELPDKRPEISAETWDWLQGREGRVLEWRKLEGKWTSGDFNRVRRCMTMEMAQWPFIVTGSKQVRA